MKFCNVHWDKLRSAITARGLGDFISKDGEEALKREEGHILGEAMTRRNFDPLMGAMWAIVNNSMRVTESLGGNPLEILSQDCPLCYLNGLAERHDRECNDPNCKRVKGTNFDGWIDQAANDMKAAMDELPPA